MIESSKIQEAFEKVEDKNNKFRIYLKTHVDSDELDRQFLELHNELFSKYDCSTCRNCCKTYVIEVLETEVESIAELLGIEKHEFLSQLEVGPDGTYELKGIPCRFLGMQGECLIEEQMPIGCVEYPYTNKPDRLFSLYSILEFASVCPVVFEMLERLKKRYNFI